MIRKISSLLVLLIALTSACAKEGRIGPYKEACNVDPKYKTGVRGNAGCFLLSEGKLLIPRDLKSGKLSLPGGTVEKGETAQCTAHRETLEEIGVKTVVGKLLTRFDNGFYLFDCKPLSKIRLKVPKSGKNEVSQVLLVEPTKTKASEWRFPAQTAQLKRIYKQQLKKR